MGLLEDFSSGLFIIQSVIFLIVLFVLHKFAWKPIMDAVNEREVTIVDSLNQAKLAKEEVQNLKAENEMIIRMRIDGTIVDYTTLSTTFHAPLIARIKILSELDIAEKRIPQDGHFKAIIEGHEINVRISTIPTVYGEKAVIRFLYNNARIDRQGQFGMNEYNYKLLYGMIQNPN